MKVLFIGSSHLVRFDRYLDANPLRIDDIDSVTFLVRSGLTIGDVPSLIGSYSGPKSFDVIYVQAAGNDLKPEVNSSLRIFQRYCDSLKLIRAVFNPRKLVIGHLFYRGVNHRFLPQQNDVDLYNAEVKKLNSLLTETASEEFGPWAIVWRHRRITSNHLLRDGTHLDNQGMKYLFKSFRGSLLTARTT